LPLRRVIAAVLLALAANGALAQYVWVDDKGVKQFSDRPPPPSVPAKNILKQPGPGADRAPAAAAATPSATAAAAPTLAEREADFRKRAQEKAEAEHKAAEEARQRAARQQACAAARANLAQLDGGWRLTASDAKGERHVVDQAERARRSAEARRTLAACK
jgi:hypothetical protein